MTDTTLAPFEIDQQPLAPPGTGRAGIGTPVPRIDGEAKVTGAARYAAEHPVPDLCYGVVVNSTIARGRIVRIDSEAARAVPGVIDVLTHENRPPMRSMRLFYKDMTAPAGMPLRPLHDDAIGYSGQPVALVVAETFEAARHAAALVHVEYEEKPHETHLLARRDDAHDPGGFKAGFSKPPKPKGNPDAAFAQAELTVDAEFYAGAEHHNPMEMHASTVIRDARGHLTIYDKTQGSQNSRWMVSRVFGLPKRKVTVRNPFVGGAFGSGLRPQYQLLLAVMASLQLKRSVRVVMTRQQMFTFGRRPETWQRIRLGATRDGRLTALIHEAVAETSRDEDYVEVVVNWSGQLYACDNLRYVYKVVSLDRSTPMDMRAPGAAHGVHALEIAMDELAYAAGIDPLELRRINYAERDSNAGLPFSTKQLMECYAQGARAFGWNARQPAPRSMRDGHELVGWGMATGTWDAMQMAARASARLLADGRLEIGCAATDIGTGTYTAISQIAAEVMGMALERVVFRLGDSDLPFAPIEGGSSHIATVGSAVHGACEKLQRQLWRLAREIPERGFDKCAFEDVAFRDGNIVRVDRPETAMPLEAVLLSKGRTHLEVRHLLLPDLPKQKQSVRAVHSAVFCEVKVDEVLGAIRVTRVVSAVAAGRIVNPLTARSQITGGVVWGISQALFEETHADHRLGRFMNHNLAEYHIASNADIGDIDVIFVDEDDRIVSRFGAKGVGEIGIVGVAAAISNAIFHATGKRFRTTPITADKVVSA
ncbi:xanthine dehydrogenase family protein molybdopterin-binding subunit [Cupriavidus agavae]|uniref:Xanthine dehydrogenase molybdenum binding subunit apoprotein n=1 Tax=Cupriavidus agavae TaxID=1001822 RepID=A0A4Q7S8M8_9BURK|nr:xanthine dehydrogenase family protein molybdopterin-binding subunit [Cupriavidus agavae]RZT42110.1 xanthine dehydrogenase molybdenum binding subunit apoprotein [Cupriavidus agavae]